MQITDISEGQKLNGVVPGIVVEVLSIGSSSPDAVNIIYETATGNMGRRTIYTIDAPDISKVVAGQWWTFSESPENFKMAAEAYRIRLAHLFDPLMAVHTSSVDPLPHQISAVYEHMLPKLPLRYILADDPGAGKTIMAGLLIRELIMRGDVERCLIVAPGGLVDQWQDELHEKFNLAFDIYDRSMMEGSRTGNPF